MSSGTCAIGGETDESENYIAPTVITGVKPTDPLMENEVYSPTPPHPSHTTVSGIHLGL